MKRMIICAAAGLFLLSGCTSASTAAVGDDGTVRVEKAGIGIKFPENWTVYVGDEMYSQVYERYSESYANVGEMKKAFETEGQEYIVYALSDGGSAIAVVTSQDLTVGEGGEKLDEPITAADYARSVHDNTIFEYRASGYMTSGSSFEEVTLGGKSGWRSEFAVTENDESGALIIGMSEFMFEQGNDVYSVQLLYSDENSLEQTRQVELAALS